MCSDRQYLGRLGRRENGAVNSHSERRHGRIVSSTTTHGPSHANPSSACDLHRQPHYSFIEPKYTSFLGEANDQHPPHKVSAGEQLIAEVYNTVRNSPGWNETLL